MFPFSEGYANIWILQILHSCCLHSFSERASIKIMEFLIMICPEDHIEAFVLNWPVLQYSCQKQSQNENIKRFIARSSLRMVSRLYA